MDSLLADAFEQLLSGHCSPHRVRAIEAGESADALWQELLNSGFVDAMVSAEDGGAGLGMTEVAPLVFSCGRHALPLPLAHTVVARALLVHAGITVPEGAITIASQVSWESNARMIVAANLPYGRTADWAVLKIAGEDWLVPLGEATRTPSGGHASLMADATWSTLPSQSIPLSEKGTLIDCDWQAVGGALMAAQLAGAMERLTDMTIAYANDRAQFGKPISKLQVIQQQISVMAEQTFSARTAALIGLSSTDAMIDPIRAAIAKARTSEAVVIVAAVSHSVHGAIGVTEEYDLQLYTRRIHEWRMQYGSESYWNLRLGQSVLEAKCAPLQFIQEKLSQRRAVAQA